MPFKMSNKEELEFLAARIKQRFTSDILWHFVSREKNDNQSFEILLSILKTGLHVGTKNEFFKFINWKTKQQETTWGYPVSCLADIPLKDLHIHIERYGKFAIGFYKSSAIKQGFHPVLYANQYSATFAQFMELRDDIYEELGRSSSPAAAKFEQLMTLLGSVCKSGDLLANPSVSEHKDFHQINNFYYEREWRSISNWDFKPADVALVILPESDLPRLNVQKKDLRLENVTPVLPLKLIYQL